MKMEALEVLELLEEFEEVDKKVKREFSLEKNSLLKKFSFF